MLPISAGLAALLAGSTRNATAEILIQFPSPFNSLQPAGQILLDGVSQVTVQHNESSTMDTIDFQIANPDGRYSAVQGASSLYAINNTIPQFYPDALKVGSVNRKAIAYIGLQNISGGVVTQTVVPQGTFTLQSASGTIDSGVVTQSAHGYDLTKQFQFKIQASVPHTLFGSQTDIRYDPAYNLSNPSNDLKTYVCDAKRFMTAVTDNIYLAADFALIFGQSAPANAVNVYVGTPTSPAVTPVSSSTYTWDPVNGIVTFNSTQASNAVISIDGVPQAMAPELMLKHLFVDYGHYSPSNLSLNTTNILLFPYSGRSDTLWNTAQNIANMTAPRGVKWRLRIDEYGNILFYEDKFATTPTEVLVDERDFLKISYTLSADQIYNVVRGNASANNRQPITSISYDIDSINDNGQRDYYDIDSSLLLSAQGAASLQVKSFLDGVTSSILSDLLQPPLQITADVVPNPARQVGDKVTVVEQRDGLSGPYIIKGITRSVKDAILTESLRLQRCVLHANYNMGLPSAIASLGAPGTVDAPTTASFNATVTGKSSIIKTMSIGGTQVINAGAIVRDANGIPIIPIVSGASWNFQFSLDPTQNYDTVLWQMIYGETPNSLSSTDLMAIRLASWVTGDGAVIPASTIAAGYSQNNTHTTGTSLGSGEKAYLYSSLVYPAYTNSLPPGYGQQMASLNFVSGSGLSGQVGIGYGTAYSGSYAYYPQQKYNYFWYTIIAYNAAGATSIQRIPFCVAS